MYLSAFYFPGAEAEADFMFDLKTTYDSSVYPYGVLPKAGLDEIFFRPITILYGGNGCGKSTALNVIAEKLHLDRTSPFNRSRFFEDFTGRCRFSLEDDLPKGSRILTSDDVFDMMLDIRALNEGLDRKREELVEDYFSLRKEDFHLHSLDDIEHLRRINRSRSKTLSRFVAHESGSSVRERSNGESAILYFQDRMEPDTLCLLDEPENSLSPKNQMLLADALFEAVRYLGNQLVISTHSPFLLALPGAKIIDLDHASETVESWAALENPKLYYDFFKKHAAEFEQ